MIAFARLDLKIPDLVFTRKSREEAYAKFHRNMEIQAVLKAGPF
jgi:hypothetical protein